MLDKFLSLYLLTYRMVIVSGFCVLVLDSKNTTVHVAFHPVAIARGGSFLLFCFSGVQDGTRSLCMLGKCSTPEPHSQP